MMHINTDEEQREKLIQLGKELRDQSVVKFNTPPQPQQNMRDIEEQIQRQGPKLDRGRERQIITLANKPVENECKMCLLLQEDIRYIDVHILNSLQQINNRIKNIEQKLGKVDIEQYGDDDEESTCLSCFNFVRRT